MNTMITTQPLPSPPFGVALTAEISAKPNAPAVHTPDLHRCVQSELVRCHKCETLAFAALGLAAVLIVTLAFAWPFVTHVP